MEEMARLGELNNHWSRVMSKLCMSRFMNTNDHGVYAETEPCGGLSFLPNRAGKRCVVQLVSCV